MTAWTIVFAFWREIALIAPEHSNNVQNTITSDSHRTFSFLYSSVKCGIVWRIIGHLTQITCLSCTSASGSTYGCFRYADTTQRHPHPTLGRDPKNILRSNALFPCLIRQTLKSILILPHLFQRCI